MPKVSPEHADARRRQILEAAFRCFSRKGFHGTTMREIFEEAGLSAGAVYSYFESKGEIISALAQAGRRNVRGWMEQSADLEASPEILFDVWRQTFAFSQTGNRDNVRLDLRISAEALDNDQIRELAAGGLANAGRAFAQLVERAQDDGSIDAELDSNAVANVLLALYNGLSVHSLLDSEVDLEAAQEVVRALLTGSFTT